MNGTRPNAIYQPECGMVEAQIKTAPGRGVGSTGRGPRPTTSAYRRRGDWWLMLPSYRTPGEDTPADVLTLSTSRPMGGVL